MPAWAKTHHPGRCWWAFFSVFVLFYILCGTLQIVGRPTDPCCKMYVWRADVTVYRVVHDGDHISHAINRVAIVFSLEALESLRLMGGCVCTFYASITGCVNRLSWNESGTTLASGSDDTTVCLFDVAAGTCRQQFPTGHTRNILGIKILPCTNDQVRGRATALVLSARRTAVFCVG